MWRKRGADLIANAHFQFACCRVFRCSLPCASGKLPYELPPCPLPSLSVVPMPQFLLCVVRLILSRSGFGDLICGDFLLSWKQDFSARAWGWRQGKASRQGEIYMRKRLFQGNMEDVESECCKIAKQSWSGRRSPSEGLGP